MTERRLKEIFIETVFPTVGVTNETLLWFETVSSRQDYIEAMKQAVNEALSEVVAMQDENTRLREALKYLYICFKRDGVVASDFDRVIDVVKSNEK